MTSKISDAFYELFSISPDNENISVFTDYILVNFIENDSRYPYHIMSELSDLQMNHGLLETNHFFHLHDQFYDPRPYNKHACK